MFGELYISNTILTDGNLPRPGIFPSRLSICDPDLSDPGAATLRRDLHREAALLQAAGRRVCVLPLALLAPVRGSGRVAAPAPGLLSLTTRDRAATPGPPVTPAAIYSCGRR